MKIAILGTGSVGSSIGKKLLELGHDVMMGSRSIDNEKLKLFVDTHSPNAKAGTFQNAAEWCELAINCTKGNISLELMKTLQSELKNKILWDLCNPLEQIEGQTVLSPSLCNTHSLGEEIQNALPETKVVKALNTMWCGIMVNPQLIAHGDHHAFLCGNDEDSKSTIKNLLREIGWLENSILDLGTIQSSRGMEMVLPLWLKLYGQQQTSAFNFKIVR